MSDRTISMLQASRLAGLVSSPLDMLIIGGGIVGAGVARDAAMRGLRVGLVDRFDFAFGASSRSSRLLHGGLRYLAQGRVGLVRQASLEKVTLHRIAPHLSAPLPFIFPARRGSDWKLWKLSLGVKLYDLLCGGRNLGKSSSLSADETIAAVPGLSADNLSGAVRYFDGFTNDSRLALDTLRSAASHGAIVCNYTALVSASRDNSGWRCTVEDHISGEKIEIATRSVINAAGAWADQMPASNLKLRLTKGSHLVIDRARLAISQAVVMTEGPRILFAIPWGERVILGTTDTDYTGDRAAVHCTREDADYILRVVNREFPAAKLSLIDVISAWAGLRPLIAARSGRPSDISRRHEIHMTQPGWFDVAGGKLTTYRLMAEEAVDLAIKVLGVSVGRCTTATTPLLEQPDGQHFSGILPPEVSRDAVEHFCRNEWAINLSDIMIRRSRWRYYHRDHLGIAERVAEWAKEILGWDDTRKASELAAYREETSLLF